MSHAAEPRRFVFLDRDGTLIEERHYLSRPEDVCLLPGVASALGELASLGCGLVIVTNQAGVGRGLFGSANLDAVHKRLVELLSERGVRLDGIYACLHAPDDNCSCRKPKLGLFSKALGEHKFDPAKSFMIGDKALDIEFGRAAGLETILVRTGYGGEVERDGLTAPHHVVDGLPAAAIIINDIIKKYEDQRRLGL